MAMNGTQQNVGSVMQDLCKLYLDTVGQATYVVKMFATEDLASITDEEWQEFFPNKDAAKALGAKNALNNLLDALGDIETSSSIAARLLKFVNNVPG